MKVPFAITGQHATLRYVDRDGRKRVVGGRRSYLIGRVVIDAVLTGWGHDFEMRITPRGPWHRVVITPAEAAAQLDSHVLSRRRLVQLRRRADYVGPAAD